MQGSLLAACVLHRVPQGMLRVMVLLVVPMVRALQVMQWWMVSLAML